MENILYGISYVLSTLFELYIISKFMKMFLGSGTIQKKYVVVAYIARFIVCTIQYAYLPYPLLNSIVVFSTLFIISLCYDGSVVKKMVSTVLIFMCLFASEVVVAGVLTLSNVSIMEKSHNGNAFSLVGIQVMLWIIYEIMSAFKNINTEALLPKGFNLAIIALSGIIFALETTIFMQRNIDDNIKIMSVACMLMVLFLIVYLYDSISKNYIEKMQSEIIEREKNYYYKQVELLQHSGKQLSDLRHDMNNHLYALSAMIDSANVEARNYVERLTEKIDKTKMFSSTGNTALDSVINYKLSKAENESIEIISKIVLPKQICGAVEDIVTILGNLLDNAIEATERVDNGRYIDLNIKYKSGVIFITVKNSYDGLINQKNGKIETRKKNKAFHGIGLKSVKAAVERNNGTMDIEHNNKEFGVKVMLYI